MTKIKEGDMKNMKKYIVILIYFIIYLKNINVKIIIKLRNLSMYDNYI